MVADPCRMDEKVVVHIFLSSKALKVTIPKEVPYNSVNEAYVFLEVITSYEPFKCDYY